MSTRITVVPVVIMAFACAGVAQATPVTFAFEGDITFVSDRDGILGGQVNVGDTFSGSYTFESTTPDSEPHPRFGYYDDAISQIDGQAGGVPFSSPSGSTSYINIRNNEGGLSDSYFAFGDVLIADRAVTFSIQLFGSDTTQLSDDSLLLVPPELTAFSPRLLFLGGSESAGINIQADVSSLVLIPEPHTLTLVVVLALGFAFCGGRIGKRSGHGLCSPFSV
ncbi:MAG: hypothetical protein H6817_03440 [Phycisphaerales bacterium]|nr:hypothetical protein [Phycisphaerales bacterium]